MIAVPDYNRASSYALNRLDSELDPRLTYHSIRHTRDDVVPAAERIATMLKLSDKDVLLLRTAAMFHDIGFVQTRSDHEAAGVEIARLVLPDCGYNTQQIESICGMILATKLPQLPQNLLEEIIADADLDVLGRPDFPTKNRLLRQEVESFGPSLADVEWYSSQLNFLKQHRYFTIVHTIRNAQKHENIALLERILAEAED